MAAVSDIIAINMSVVITAATHNPSILNPNFLTANNIVPDSWDVKETITTPALSYIQYANAVDVRVDPAKLIITLGDPDNLEKDTSIYDVAKAYVSILNYVPYQHLGLNWTVAFHRKRPREWIRDRYLKTGAKLQLKPHLISAAVTLEYATAEAVCKLSIEPGSISMSDEDADRPSAIVKANFHHKGPLIAAELVELIGRWQERRDFLQSLLQKILRGKMA